MRSRERQPIYSGYGPPGEPGPLSYAQFDDGYTRPPPPQTYPDKPEKKPIISFCIGTVLTVCCACLSCGCCVFVVALLVLLGPVGVGLLLASVGVFFIALAIFYCLHQFVIEDTHFTLFNFFIPFLKYGLISQFKGEIGVKNMWKNMASPENPKIAEGFGPNTYTFFGWAEACAMLSSWGDRIRNGTMRRHNELGTAIMGSGPWPETGTIALGFSNQDHGVARPYIGRAVDGSRRPEGEYCDGSNGWNRDYLRQVWRQRFQMIDQFNTSDVGWWCTIILHKIHVNMDLTDDEAQSFMNFPSCLSFPGAGKVGVGLGNFTDRELCLIPCLKCCSPLPCFNWSRQEHVEDLKDALQVKYPGEDWSEEKLKLTANMFMDSLMYAGGLSVPSVLMNMLAWWYKTQERPAELGRVTAQDENSIKDFMWEAMRRNPPVAGVPRWVTDDGGASWTHEVANVEQAMQDERVFQDPMSFQMGRPGLNAQDYSRSMFWADFAIVNNDTCNPDSHNCPGKMLSMEMIVAFWQEFLLYKWTTDAQHVDIGYNLTSTFNLDKQ